MSERPIPTNEEFFVIVRPGKPVEFSRVFEQLSPALFKSLLLKYRWIKIRYQSIYGEIRGTFSIDPACDPEYVKSILGSNKIF